MNTEDKEQILKSFLKHCHTNPPQAPPEQIPQNLTSDPLPQINLISQLLTHQSKIQRTVDTTYKEVKNVLEELSELQTRKQNINKLLDSMTAMKEVKRLSYGLGNTPTQIYKNLVSYFQVKDKVFYCDRYVVKVEEQIAKVKESFSEELEQQLRKANSENISEISKTLSLLSSSNSEPQNTHIIKFYISELKKQLKIYEQDLLKIPITAPAQASTSSGTIGNNYLFFDIAKDIMKTIVTMVNNYRSNIIKIGGLEALQGVINAMLDTVMAGILLEIFMREKKYFEVDSMDSKKMSKFSNKFKDYLNQFCAIWNQIQRLKSHLLLQVPLTHPNHKSFQNSLINSTNTKQLITINHQASEGVKIYTRFQFNNLLKISTFVNSIFQNDFEFLNKIYENFTKSGKQYMESQDAVDFVGEMFGIIVKPLEKAFQSLNMLIISTLITFANTNLIQQDSFHAFNELFNKTLPKMSIGQQKYHTSLIILLNTVLVMPNILRSQLSLIKIPPELQKHRPRLQSQLKQLSQVCEYKTKQTLTQFLTAITTSSWFISDLKQDYKKTIDKWKGFMPEINDLFFNRVSILHCGLVLNDEFNVNGKATSKKVTTQNGIIGLEKEVMGIVGFYQAKGVAAINNFRKVLEYIEIMLADGQENANKLIKKFSITDPEQIQKIQLLRALKVD